MVFRATDLIAEAVEKKKVPAKVKCPKKTCAKKTCDYPPKTCCKVSCAKTTGGGSTCKYPSNLCGGSFGGSAPRAAIVAEVARLQLLLNIATESLNKKS